VFQIVKSWVKHLTRLKGYTDQMVEDANAVILTFGSYRLGVSIVCPMLDLHIFMLRFIFGELKPNGSFNFLFQL